MAEQEVKVISWPREEAKLSHSFEEASAPVKITFQETPVHLALSTDKGQELNANLNMGVTIRETIPVCVKLCEPICAESDYKIGIDLFNQSIASISIKGLTRLFNCRERQETIP
jgi:hypothetical protein